MQDLTISLIQTSLSWENPEANLLHFGNTLLSLQEPTNLIILPEMFNTGFTMNASSNAEEMDGLSMQWMVKTARDKQCVICGSLIIRDDGKYYNRLIWMKPDGSYEHYDKKHLFRMGDEHLHFAAGEQKLIATLKGWKIMPLICYDLRFPVWSKNDFSNDEYAFDLLIYVANWPAIRSQAWTSLITGRAIENMAYAAGVNRIGSDGRGYEYEGRSMIAGPDGNTLLEIKPNQEAISTLTLNADPMLQLRAKLGVGKDWDSFNLL
jgi:omega-amidase